MIQPYTTDFSFLVVPEAAPQVPHSEVTGGFRRNQIRCVYACVDVFGCTCVTAHMWKSEDNSRESVLSSHDVGPKNQTQVVSSLSRAPQCNSSSCLALEILSCSITIELVFFPIIVSFLLWDTLFVQREDVSLPRHLQTGLIKS